MVGEGGRRKKRNVNWIIVSLDGNLLLAKQFALDLSLWCDQPSPCVVAMVADGGGLCRKDGRN